MTDNFNMKQFLAENKLGAYSKLKENDMSEGESQTHFYITGLTNDKKNQQIKDIAAKAGLNIKMKIINPEDDVQITLPGGKNFKMKDAEKIAKILNRLDIEWEDTIGLGFSMSEAKEKEEEGYMGTQYDSSEDMAADMIKKGITREEIGGNIGDAEAEKEMDFLAEEEPVNERLSSQAFGRMSQLSNFKAQQAMIRAAEIMMRDLTEEGFEVEEIREYFNQLIANDI